MSQKFQLPSAWSDWELTDLLGRGSYGSVFEARFRDPNAEEDEYEDEYDDYDEYDEYDDEESLVEDEHAIYSAIKILSVPSDETELNQKRLELNHDDSLVEAFYQEKVDELLREIRAMESLRDNPNVVQIQDHYVEKVPGKIQWNVYIRMEKLTPLMDYLTEHPITEELVTKIGIDICNILEECAERKILHRDIKLENIMVSKENVFKLGDFGVVRLMDEMTSTAMSVRGTYSYMAPEVYHMQKYDDKVDQYSLGITLYRLMNKRRWPFVDTEKQMITSADQEKAIELRMSGTLLPPPCEASEGFAIIICRACAYEKADRFASAKELKKYLIKLSKGETIKLAPLTEKKVKSKKKSWIAVAVSACLITGGWLGYRQVQSSLDPHQKYASGSSKAEYSEDADILTGEILDTELNLSYGDELMQSEDLSAVREMLGEDANGEYDNLKSHLVYAEGDVCLAESVSYEAEEDADQDHSDVRQDWKQYFYKKNGDTWERSDASIYTKSMLESMNKVYCPEGYLDALESGRNTYSYDGAYWQDTDAYFDDFMNMSLPMIWQNEDGSIDMLVVLRNGNDYPCNESALVVGLEDETLGTILKVKVQCDIDVPEKSVVSKILHVEADQVRTGMQEWTGEIERISFGYNSDNDWF